MRTKQPLFGVRVSVSFHLMFVHTTHSIDHIFSLYFDY